MSITTPDPSMILLPKWVELLVNAGHSAPSADNSQPWRFFFDGKNLNLLFDHIRCAKGLGRHHPAVQMAFGTAIENMCQAGIAVGMDMDTWDFRYLTDTEDPLLVVPAPITDLTDAQSAELKIFNRHTNRNKFSKKPVPAKVVTETLSLTESDCYTMIHTNRNSVRKMASFVRQASEIRFQTEDALRWLGENLRFSAQEVDRGDGLDIETLALPPGGRLLLKFIADWRRMQALNRLHAYKFLAFVEGMQFGQCSGVVTIVGPDDNDPARWINAGRLMERVWLLLNRKGLSVHPYFVLPDLFYRLKSNGVPEHLREKAISISASAREFLGLKNQTLFMIMRIGTDKYPPVRSKRLPLEAVLSYQEAN